MAVEDVREGVLTAAHLGLLANECGDEALGTHKFGTVSEAVTDHGNMVVGERSAIIRLDAVAADKGHMSLLNGKCSIIGVKIVVTSETCHIQSTVKFDAFANFVVNGAYVKQVSSRNHGEAFTRSEAVAADGDSRVGEWVAIIYLVTTASGDGEVTRRYFQGVTTVCRFVAGIRGAHLHGKSYNIATFTKHMCEGWCVGGPVDSVSTILDSDVIGI